VKLVHVSVGTHGAVASITIALFAHNDPAAHGATNVNVALFSAISFIVHPSNTNPVVLAKSKSAPVSHDCTIYVNANVLVPLHDT